MKIEISREDNGIGICVLSRGTLKEVIPLNEALALIDQLSWIVGDMRYGAWLTKVQAEVNARAPVALTDLSDFCYRDAFEAHESPRETARHVLDDNGYGYFEDGEGFE